MILDPEYDAEHDKQLYNARKGFHSAQNGPQSGQKWLFVLYYSVDFGPLGRGQKMTMEH